MGNVEALLARMADQRVYLDSNIFVYFLDRNPEYFPVVAPIMQGVESGRIPGRAGDAALAEVMVKPYRMGDPALIAAIKAFFGAARSLSILPHDTESFDLASQMRARHGMKFLGALHVATALRAGFRYFLTNDTDFRALDVIEIVAIGALIA